MSKHPCGTTVWIWLGNKQWDFISNVLSLALYYSKKKDAHKMIICCNKRLSAQITVILMIFWQFYCRSKILNDLLKGVAQNNLLALEFLEPYLGNTALIQASREHHTAVVERLLVQGANVNLQNFAGKGWIMNNNWWQAYSHKVLCSAYLPKWLKYD